MQNNTQHFIGIDVSKPFFDATLMPVINHQKQAMDSAHFENTELGLKLFEKWLKSHKVSFDQNTVLVIENTGIYHRLLWAFCNEIGLQIHIGNAQGKRMIEFYLANFQKLAIFWIIIKQLRKVFQSKFGEIA